MARSDYVREYVIGNGEVSNAGRSGYIRKKDDSSFLGKLAYIGESTVAGLAGVFEGIGKTFGTIGAKFAGDERLARYYARKSTVGEWQSDLAEKYSPDAITRFLGDAGAGVGQSSVFLLNLAVPGAGWAAFGTGIYGNALGSAVEKTGELGFREFTYAGLSTAGEMLAEKISGATMKAVGRIGGSVSGSLTKNAVESAATAGAKKGFIKAVASNAVLKDLLKESSSEFVEEFLGDFWDVGISRLTGVDPEASTTITSALYSGLVGFVSGGFMSGTSIIVNRAAAASRGYSIIEAGNADTMVRTAKTIVEEASQAELFKDPSGYVDALRQSVSEYESAKDKTGYGARVSLGMMQMLTAYVDKNIGLAKTKLKIANADAASLEQMASVLSYYSGEKVTAEDIKTNKDGAADRLAIMDWVNGVLTVDMDELNEAVIRDTMSGKKTVSGIAESEFDVSGGAKTVSMPDGSYLSYRKNAEGTYDYVINDGASAESGEDGVWTAKSVSEEEMRNIYESVRQKAQAYQAEVEKRNAEQAQKADAEKADGSEKAEKQKPEKKEPKRVEISSSAAEKAGKYVRNFSSLSFRDRLAIARMIESAEKYGVDEKTVKGIACMMSVRSGLEIRFSKALGQSGMWSALKGERRLIAVNPELSDAIGRTVSHELIHDMMSDSKEARDSLVEITKEYAGEDQFSEYKESRREAYFKAMNKAGAVHGEAVETVSADGKKSTEYRFASKADETYFEDVMEEEAVAHFGAEYLQNRDFLDRYGSRFAGPLKRAWNRIRNWISLVRAKDRDAAIAMESYTQTISKYLSDTYGVEELKAAMGIETDSGKETKKNESGVNDWLKVNRLQLPLPNSQSPAFKDSIHQKSENVNRKKKNTRFELKIGNQTTPVKVQETKNLIAIHNLTEQNLLDTLNLGGFPMPSIAVVKADQGHSEYGDISVIFGKETIDPQINSKNAIYGGDAWTPTYPTIEYKVAEKVADRIRNKYYDLARKFGYDDVRPLYKYANDLEDTLNKAKGEAELISSLVDDEDMMRVFLMDSGKGKIPTVQTEVRTEMSPAEVERAKFFINALGEDVVRGIKAPEGERIGFYRQKYLDEHSDAIRNAYHELLTKEYGATEEEAQRVLDNAKRYDLFRIVNDAYHYLENGGITVRTETDSAASSKAVRDAVDTKQYRSWLKDVFGGIEEKSGIRNERDPFDSRGNRRKWETLHWENTLENVVQAMLEQPDVGKGTIFSATSIWGVSAKEYKTIADMKKDTARLKTMSQQQYDTIRAGFEERLTEIADSIRDVKADNEFIARDNAISAIVEAVRTKKTGSSMLAYLKGYSNRATAQTVKDIISLVRDISDMPTQYFEAKPKRAVDFSEIKMVELPESASDTLKKQLERRKIPYEVYGKTDEDRATAVKKLNDVRFELDAKDGYSRGQMAKIVANRTKQKVYERKDAIYAIDRAADIITDYYSDAYGVRRARLRGKSRDEVIDYLFEQMNKEQGDGRLQTAVTAAEYIVNHAIIQNELDSVAADDYARLIDIVNGLDGFRKKVKLTETEIGDIRHIYDKKASAVLRSWYGENGFLPSQILTELRDSGVIVNSDSDVESDIFSDLLTAYDNAKESIAKWNEKILLSSMASKEEVKSFKNSIAHEILRAFDETGEKSAYKKEIEARQKYISDTIAKYNQKLKAARRRAMAEARLFRDAMELENLIKRDRQLHSFFQDERVKKLSESAARIGKPRNARNPSTVREWAKAMLEVYNPKNELMQIDGERDTYADPVVVEALERLSQIDENVYRKGKERKNKYLTDEQVIDLQTAVSGLKRLYREYDTVFLNGKRVSLTDTAQKGIDNFKWILDRNEKKGKRFTFLEKSALFGKDYIYEIASPLSVIADMEFHDPNGVLTQAYENIVYGQMKSQVQLAMLSEPFEKFYKENKGYSKKLAREYVHYKDVKLTKAQAISLYCTMKREQAKLGLETFGIKYVNENGKEVESGKFTTVDPDILWNQFDSTDRKFVEMVENFFNEVSKKVKSEADMRIIGSTNVLQEYYFPISRDPIQKISNMTDMRGMLDALQTVVRMSFNQNTVKHADGRLYISDVTAVLDRHMAGLAVYSNMYEELQAFNRIYNKNVTPSDALGNPIRSQMKSVREMLESTYKGANNYLNKLMADIQGVRIGEEGKFEPILNRFTGLFAQAAISGNIKTVLLPLASYPAAGLHIDAKYLMQALAMHASKKAIRENIEQMDKYSSVTKGRYMDRGAIRAQTVQSEVKGLIAYTGKGIEATERFMVSKIWNAAKLQTAAESGLAVDSDENCKLAAKLLDKTIIETQAQYVSSMKSAMARSHNPLVRGFTMFKSDAAAMFSYNFDAFRKYQHLKERADAGQDVKAELEAAKKKLPRAIGSMAASCVSFAIITQLVRYALNQDDDDEETPVKNIAMNTLNSMVSMFPVVADVYEFFVDGYEMSNFALDGINDAMKSVKNIIDLIGQKNVTNADIARTVRSALYSFGTLAGIPVRNTVNLATGVIRRFSKPTMYAYDSIFSGEQYAKDLAKAVERGDMKMAQAVINVMYEREKAGAYDEETLNEVLRLYEAGYENVIPDSVRSSVTVNGTVIDLSSDQLEQFKKIYAEADSTIQAMMQGDAYNGFSDEQKAYAIRSVYNSYKRYAAYSVTGQTDSLTGIMMELLGSEKCATARSYISGLKSDKDQKPENGWKETIRKELKKHGLSQSEIAIVLYASGYRGEEETEALIKALNAKKYSAEKLQMIAKILNLTVKNGKIVNEKPKAA